MPSPKAASGARDHDDGARRRRAHSRARADAAGWLHPRSRHRPRRRHRRAGGRRRRTLRGQPRVPPLGDRGVPRARLAAMPGCFTPTEILDAWDAGRGHRQGLSGDDARTVVSQGRARAAAAGQADADRRRHASTMPATGFAPARSRWASARRCSTPRRSPTGDFDVLRANAERMIANVRAAQRTGLMPRVVTFGELMLRLSPPGFERLLQSPMLVGDVRRRRSQRRREPGAVRPRERLHHRAAEEPDRRRRDSRAARRRRAHRPASSAAAIASASTTPRAAPASAARP